ncbi:hypothetical protein N9609_00830 [bacterium]|nr:hypothetical protein [bacterium]
MTLLQKQSYNLWFNWIAGKTMEWAKSKPANKDLKNYIQGLNEIGQYVNQLNIENSVLTKRIGMIRQSKNEAIQTLQKEIETLKEQINTQEL